MMKDIELSTKLRLAAACAQKKATALRKELEKLSLYDNEFGKLSYENAREQGICLGLLEAINIIERHEKEDQE